MAGNFIFRGHASSIGADTTKSTPFKAENNNQTLPKQVQKNFEKVQKTTFSNPNGQNVGANIANGC